jgi:hypothetical protein
MMNTAGNWNRNERNIYFIASDTDTLREGLQTHPFILCAINEITNEKDLAWLMDAAKNPTVRFIHRLRCFCARERSCSRT